MDGQYEIIAQLFTHTVRPDGSQLASYALGPHFDIVHGKQSFNSLNILRPGAPFTNMV